MPLPDFRPVADGAREALDALRRETIDRIYPINATAARAIFPAIDALDDALDRAFPNTTGPDPRPASVGSRGDRILAAATSHRGRPYQWGGTGNPSFDCSGLTQWAHRQAGVEITRTTYTQIRDGVLIGRTIDAALPGDLVFSRFSSPGVPEHVSIWAGNGKVFEAGDPIGFYPWGDRGPVEVRRCW